MKRRDLTPALVWLILGGAVAWVAQGYQVGSLSNPGAGFLPFYLGLILMGLSLPILIQALRTKAAKSEPAATEERPDLVKVGLTVAVLAGFGLALERLGYLLTSMLALVAIFKVVKGLTWRGVVLAALLSALASWLLFVVLLKSDLPAGLLGIG